MPSGSGELPKAKGRYVASGVSLDLAEELARRAGIPFDRAEAAALSGHLYETCFAAIVKALGLDPDAVAFSPEVFGLTKTFIVADPDGGAAAGRILFDETFDLWLFALSHYSTIAAFAPIDDAGFFSLLEKMKRGLLLLARPTTRPRVLEDLRPELETHPECLNVSGGMARALMVFVLCHEIAHGRLGHLDQPEGPEIELEADREAARMFLAIVARGEALRHSPIYIDPKLTGVPVILPRWLALFEQRVEALTGRPAERAGHPDPDRRAEATAVLLRPRMGETATVLLNALESGIDDFHRAMAAGH
ncbi:hypothetical protein [Rhodospira trueperi]|uniref:Uncharacterized protein n=1 Tax=Rhodospira trueperi TaxID=69960 RepID=A0A1G7I806_9PROT|nr:hypothetical protein [Rhodospira trueperi]SDF08861.1 hypothetical protein SAMN05421720_1323 [Rhodospira trueperi]